MSIKSLEAIVAPPETPPAPRSSEEWEGLQQRLGTKLPKDLLDIATRYGGGRFCYRGALAVFIYHPFSSDFADKVDEHSAMLEAVKSAEGPDSVPYGIHPESPGLLVWGGDDNGNEFYWNTDGTPDKWPIVVRSEDNEYETFYGPITDFLCGIFQQRITVSFWDPTIFADANNIEFVADAPAHAIAAPKNVYEHYVENNCQAGFWLKHVERPNTCYLIKSVNNQTSGKLPGIPSEYGRPPVEADAYHNGEFSEPAKLAAHQRVYVKVDKP